MHNYLEYAFEYDEHEESTRLFHRRMEDRKRDEKVVGYWGS